MTGNMSSKDCVGGKLSLSESILKGPYKYLLLHSLDGHMAGLQPLIKAGSRVKHTIAWL